MPISNSENQIVFTDTENIIVSEAVYVRRVPADLRQSRASIPCGLAEFLLPTGHYNAYCVPKTLFRVGVYKKRESPMKSIAIAETKCRWLEIRLFSVGA